MKGFGGEGNISVYQLVVTLKPDSTLEKRSIY